MTDADLHLTETPDPTTTPTPTNEQQDARMYAPGDADPTWPPSGPAVPCDAVSPDEWGYVCTWPKGHVHPQHVAGDSETVCAVWPVLATVSAAALDEREALRAAIYKAIAQAVIDPELGINVLVDAATDAALAARPAPTVNAADVEITTAAELDALPAGTIVRDRFGGYLAQGRDAMGVAWFHYPVYDHAGSSAIVAGIGPVTVCFTPGLTVVDEGRAEA